MLAIETPNFHFHNANPKGKKAADCVVRAIAVALGQTWEETMREMTELGIKHGLVFNEDKLIDLYLNKKGWFKMKEPRDCDNKKISVERFAKGRGSSGVFVARAGSHHLTLIADGVVWDTWDCSKKTMHSFYTNPMAKAPKLEREQPKPEKRRFTL